MKSILEWLASLFQIATKQDAANIMAKLSELEGIIGDVVTLLNEAGVQFEKGIAEVIKAVQGNDPDVPQAVLDKINALKDVGTALKTSAEKLDALNEDEAPPTP